MRSSKPHLIGAVAAALLLIVLIFSHGSLPGGSVAYEGYEGIAKGVANNTLMHVMNETLGFQHIFVMALPERSDRRDAMSLQASFTGIKFKWIQGVKGESVPEKAVPPAWPIAADKKGVLGSWRGHMNIIQRMAKDNIQSALIMEDDADWDVMLKSQLLEFARGTRYLQAAQQDSVSPYGDDWDILWLGICKSKNDDGKDQQYYIINKDPTVVPAELRTATGRFPNVPPQILSDKYTRVIYEPSGGGCTYGYAVSLRGARALLYYQGLTAEGTTMDKALKRLCKERTFDTRCFAPYPALIGTHKPAGDTSRDSDREETTGAIREKAVTQNIVYSTRLNLENMVRQKAIESQYPEDTLFPSYNDSIEIPRGYGTMVSKEQFAMQDKLVS
ncbi:hypothetical protein BP6252_05264 [Coleophoma cylindrospora]|uniref:Glycosyl transferase family 25 domain-containing protein n=1 Tax=Coleophoma cylindrospora TaxID=1849047 RepID=A0A3D8RTS9_9HELO|nr:hypothetical protein BP6252_05264 [Coleophoma cylindrospora]